MLRPSALPLRLLHRPKRCYIAANDTAPFHAGFWRIPLRTGDTSKAILPLCFGGVHQRISPWISPLHRATMPQDSEMFCRDLQILAHANIRDREGMQHNAANHQLGRQDAHRHIEHPPALKSPIFSHLSGIDIQRVVS